MNDTVLRRPAAWIIVAAVVAAVAVAVAVWVISSVGGSTDAASADGTVDAADTSQAAPAGEGDPQDASEPSTTTGSTSDRPPAPDVTLDLRQGGTVPLSDFEGEPVVLNFWASWCPPCVSEMGEILEPAHQEYGDRLTLLGVNLSDQPEDAQDIIDTTGVTYQSALDPDGEIFAAFGGVGMPTTVFIDSQGRIVEKHTGILTEGQLKAQVDTLLEG